MKNKTYFITGGAGFIGSNLAYELSKDKNNKIKIYDNLNTGKLKNIKELLHKPNVEFIEGDILDFEKLSKSIQCIDFCFHLAAIPSVQKSIKDPKFTNKINVMGTLNILIAAKEKEVKRVIYSSSAAVYGDLNKKIVSEDEKLNPLSPYALEKITSEKYCKLFYKLYGLETICLRYFNVFGEMQDIDSEYSGVISLFLNNALKNKEIKIYGDGEQTRDFIYVKDVVNANILATKTTKGIGECYNIASGKSISINNLVKKIRTNITSNSNLIYAEHRKGDIKESYADISKAKKILKYAPTYSFDCGLKNTIKYIKTSHQ